MNKYRLINYFDVWGNEEDGWEVNNLCKEGEVELPENYGPSDVLAALQECQFFNDSVTLEKISIQDDFYFIEIFDASNNRPECRLELI